jgi:hypothetical protein
MKELTIYITGLNLSTAFSTIKRDELLAILEMIVGQDEVRMIRLLLSNTSLEIKMNSVMPERFESNVGSPQGNVISGVLFNIYLEDALRREQTTQNQMDTNIEHGYAKKQESSSLPTELCYADDADHTTLDTNAKGRNPARNIKGISRMQSESKPG